MNKHKTNNFIWGELINGELGFIVENRPKDKTGCPGKWLFEQMMNHFGSSVLVVRGSWTYGDNLASINLLAAAGTMSVEEAAMRTWTGTRAAEWGFVQIEVLQTTGSPGNYTNIQSRFKK